MTFYDSPMLAFRDIPAGRLPSFPLPVPPLPRSSPILPSRLAQAGGRGPAQTSPWAELRDGWGGGRDGWDGGAAARPDAEVAAPPVNAGLVSPAPRPARPYLRKATGRRVGEAQDGAKGSSVMQAFAVAAPRNNPSRPPLTYGDDPNHGDGPLC